MDGCNYRLLDLAEPKLLRFEVLRLRCVMTTIGGVRKGIERSRVNEYYKRNPG
jgi:hypothetical protein